MSNVPNSNPYQSALNQQHPNLPLQSQNMRSVNNIPQGSNINQNLSVQNSLNPQQQQSVRQSQQNMIQSQKNKNQINSMEQSNMRNSQQNQKSNLISTQQQTALPPRSPCRIENSSIEIFSLSKTRRAIFELSTFPVESLTAFQMALRILPILMKSLK